MKTLTVILILLLFGCNSKNESNTKVLVKKETNKENISEKKTRTNGLAVFKQRGYNAIKLPAINVNYSGYNSEHFEFKSDEDDKTDTNGDGYIVFGKQDGKKFRLTILDLNNGKTYDSGNKITIQKKEDFFLGSGLLGESNTNEMVKISFWVVF